MQYTTIIQVGSCDEVYCDLSIYKENQQFLQILQSIKYKPWHTLIMSRDQIYQTTNCTCSIGVGHNIIMARIATKKYLFL